MSVRTTAPRPTATPIPGALWEAQVTDSTAIVKELARMWSVVPMAEEIASIGGEDADSGVALTRAGTLNLTAFARSRAAADRAEHAIDRLGDLYPSRATILVSDPGAPRHEDGGLDVKATLLEQPAGRGRPVVRFEEIRVAVNPDDERLLASIAAPLLVTDLPDFLWWTADTILGGRTFAEFCEISDRQILDTSGAADPADELGRIHELLSRPGNPPRISDFAWRRTVPWRKLLTQFFDPPATRDALAHVDEVQISYAVDGDGRSGFTGALLLAGWLASRLDWQAPGELVRARGGAGWHVTLRAGAAGERREVSLALEPLQDPTAGCAPAAVSLVAHADAATSGTFRIERFDPQELATSSQLAGQPASRRMAYAAIPDDAALLADELRQYGRDGVYEAALAVAAALAPHAVA